MSALLKSLAEVSKSAFKAPDLKLIHSKVVPVPDLRTEKVRAEKAKKIFFISLGATAGFLLLAYFFMAPIISILSKNNSGKIQPTNATEIGPKELYEKSVTAYNTGNFKEAISGFEKLSKMSPNDFVSANNLALSTKASGNINAARILFEKASAKFPKDSVLLNNWAVLEFEHGSMELAEKKLKSSLAIRPTYKEALLNLAHLYEFNGNWSGALENYEKYLEGKNGEGPLAAKIRERIRKINSLSLAGKNSGERI